MAKARHKRVAIIGAGISGVVTAAHLKKEHIDVVVFERSKSAGGIWLFDERKPLEPTYPSIIASKAEAHYKDSSTTDEAASASDKSELLHAPPGPCYAGLKNNVGTRLLQTTLNAFPADTPDFVSHEVLCDYIQDTSIKSGVHALTVYNTEVKNLRKVGNKWKLDAVTLSTSQSPSAIGQNSAAVDSNGNVFSTHHSQEFDAVVVASGHYHAARIPDIPGLADWKRQLPHRVQHSKSYRRPEDYAGKNFLLIGGSVSATDIARELGPFAQHIYQSHRNGAFDLPASLLPDNAIRVDEIASFEGISGNTGDPSLLDADVIPASVILKSGQKLCNIHHVIVCTGYHVTLPFLPDLHSDETSPEEVNDTLLVTDGNQLHNLHKDIFYIRDPSLVFVGVPYFTATFTLFEFQAMVVAKVLSGQVTLPNEKDMRIEYHKRVQSKGYGKGFHSLRDQEVQYVDELLEWVNRNLVDLGKEKLNGHTRQWHEAKEEQVERIKALFAAGPGPERKLETVCW